MAPSLAQGAWPRVPEEVEHLDGQNRLMSNQLWIVPGKSGQKLESLASGVSNAQLLGFRSSGNGHAESTPPTRFTDHLTGLIPQDPADPATSEWGETAAHNRPLEDQTEAVRPSVHHHPAHGHLVPHHEPDADSGAHKAKHHQTHLSLIHI